MENNPVMFETTNQICSFIFPLKYHRLFGSSLIFSVYPQPDTVDGLADRHSVHHEDFPSKVTPLLNAGDLKLLPSGGR